MHIDPLILASLGFIGVATGRVLFARWFNHFTIYSLVWGTGLTLFEWGLIDYTPLLAEVWMLLGYAWIAFAAGAAIAILAKTAVGERLGAAITAYPPQTAHLEKRLLFTAIVVLSFISMLAVIQHWTILLKKFGSVAGVLINGKLIYHYTVTGKIPGKIPYFDSFALAAACLAGVYSAREGKIKLIALPPFLFTILSDVAQGGRAKIIIAGILFFSAYFLTRMAPTTAAASRPISRGWQLLTITLVTALLLGAAEFVRAYRGASEEFYGVSTGLQKFKGNVLLTPSIYLYLSGHPGVFNAYWKAEGVGEQIFPGAYTFAPLFRILAKIGLADEVPFFQKFYNTPIYINTGTYLRELHADFGVPGILIGPVVLGWLCTMLWIKIRRLGRLAAISILTHLYVVVIFSFLYQITRLGQWVVSLIVAMLVSGLIDHRSKTAAPSAP